MLDFRNINTLWSSILVETLFRLGLKNAVICPGSRSTPLTIAFAAHNHINATPVLDERSAVFFALGIAKRTHIPVALVCSSGTAAANFLPGVIEAQETGVSLIILTADRPPELRHCHAGQTTDQIKLYGNYPNWYTELAIPEANNEMLIYLRQNMVQAWEKSLFPYQGVVHLNCPFREPLAPIIDSKFKAFSNKIDYKNFFDHLDKDNFIINEISQKNSELEKLLPVKGIIIAGLAQPKYPKKYCQEIAFLADKLQFPVLAEALSPVRNYASLNPNLITTYDTILRDTQQVAKLQPEVIIQIGELPTSKQLRQWIAQTSASRYIIAPNQENFDPLHGKTIHLRTSVADFINRVTTLDTDCQYLKTWCEIEHKTQKAIATLLNPLETLYEGKAAWLISQNLPPQTPIFFANSMTVRNAEFFWQSNNSEAVAYFNRGANGIDGTLSTALGIAHSSDRPAVMLTGDLALLHDTNGFLINNHLSGHLTIILINNNGGGIFEILPISKFDPPFEEYFATPQNVDFAQLSKTYNVEYQLITDWQQLPPLLNPLPTTGIRILEIKSDRKKDARWLQKHLWQLRPNSSK